MWSEPKSEEWLQRQIGALEERKRGADSFLAFFVLAALIGLAAIAALIEGRISFAGYAAAVAAFCAWLGADKLGELNRTERDLEDMRKRLAETLRPD